MGIARSIMDGKGYAFSDTPHTKYPPLLPVILAAAGLLRGLDDYQFLQYIIALFWLASVAITYLLFSGKKLGETTFAEQGLPKGPLTGLVLALLITASIYMLQYATAFLRTEMVYTAFSLASVYVGLRLVQKAPPSWTRIVLFAVLFQCAYFTRMAGLALLGALVVVFITDKDSWIRRNPGWGRAALLVLLCVSGPTLWMVRNQWVATPESSGYAAEFLQSYGLDLTKNRDMDMETIDLPGVVGRLAENTAVFSESCGKMLLNSNKGGARLFLRITAGLLCIFGLFLSLVRRGSLVDYYCLLYLALYLIWPFNQQQRFYLPILPFLIEYAAISLRLLNRLLPYLLRQTGVWYLFIALQILLMGILFGGRSQNPDFFGRYSAQYLAFTAVVTVVFLVADIYLFAERARPGGLKSMVKSMRAGLPVLYLAGYVTLAFYELIVIYPERHLEYIQAREANPAPPALENIEVHPEFIKLASWIINHTDRQDVIMCDVPKMLHIMTGRRTVPFTFSSRKGELATEVFGLKPAYVYYSGEIGWVYRIFKKACRDYEKVFSRWVEIGPEKRIEPAMYRID